MFFLDAKTVRLVKHFEGSTHSVPVYTDDISEQLIIISMAGEKIPELIELVVYFDDSVKLPKKISISANQYTMNPFDIDVKLTKKSCTKPYHAVKMGELRTVLDIEPNTRKVVFSFSQEQNKGKHAQIRFRINYITF